MTNFAGVEPFAIRAHNDEALREVSKLRLEKRLRDHREPRPGRSHAFVFKRPNPLPR